MTWNEMMTIWYSAPFCCIQSHEHFIHFIPQQACSVLGLLNFLRSIQALDTELTAGGYHSTIATTSYRRVPIHTWVEWQCRVNPGWLMRVHYIDPITLLPQCEKPRFRGLHLVWSSIECSTFSVQWPPIQVLTLPPSTNSTHHGSTLSMLQNQYLHI